MPENLIRCRNCRTLLNTDLEPDSVEIPAFVPVQELESVLDVPARGYFVTCPHCDRELRINAKHRGSMVECNHCAGAFQFDFNNPRVEKLGVYVDCPHCTQRLRMATKYIGIKVACKFCSGRVRVID